MLYVDVILPLPLDGLFTYSVPQEWEAKVCPYVRAKVPFGITKTHTALIVRSHNNPPQGDFEVKSIISIIDDEPILLPAQYDMWQWISKYYMSPMGDVMQAALPHGIKKEDTYRPKTEVYIRLADQYKNEQSLHNAMNMLSRSPKQMEVFTAYLDISGWAELKEKHSVSREELINVAHCTTAHVKALVNRGFLQIYDKEIGRLNSNEEPHPENIKTLSAAQQEALDKLRKDNGAPSSAPILFHGVTSSGKTEVYIHLIQEAIDKGLQVLYLLPEIALTAQVINRLRHYFGDTVGVYHSRFSTSQRAEVWKRTALHRGEQGRLQVLLGARSALFLPFNDLALVVVDEEHDASYKEQERAPRYNARDAAVYLAHLWGARTVLGSATPSIESTWNALSGRYALASMQHRYGGFSLPKVTCVDMREERRLGRIKGHFSSYLLQRVADALKQGRQVILFQNRRGFAMRLECHDCHAVPQCVNCDVSLVYHKATNSLRCHYCGFSIPVPQECPQCHSTHLQMVGIGTERIEEDLQIMFPDACVARMDLDSTMQRSQYADLLRDFAEHRIDILVGTQMVTKGLDFDNVSVVGIVSADNLINYPSYRSYERAFQQMTQVSGRAGRHAEGGEVVIQTYCPEHQVIRNVIDADYRALYSEQIEERRVFRYPPFYRMIEITLKHREAETLNAAADWMAVQLRSAFAGRVMGPEYPLVSRVRALYLKVITLRFERSEAIANAKTLIQRIAEDMVKQEPWKRVSVHFDVDPY